MQETILSHIMDLLQADPDIYAAGTSWATPFNGVTRESAGDTPVLGAVNLYDSPYVPGSVGARPGVYCGTTGEEFRDQREEPSVGSTQFRILRVPLVVAVLDPKGYVARKKRHQLRFNVCKVLYKHQIENGFWYYCWEESDTSFTRDTGGGDSGAAQSVETLYFNFQYTRTISGTQA